MSRSLFLSLILFLYPFYGGFTLSPPHALYSRLNPRSIAQHLAFYELYPTHPLGQRALREGWQLLTGSSDTARAEEALSHLSSESIALFIACVNRTPTQRMPILSSQLLGVIEDISAQRLVHHQLEGHHRWEESQLVTLPDVEFDLARALLVSQFGDDKMQIRSYEAVLDLMALQIAAQLPSPATPQQKIAAISRFIFEEMAFRFPPHSLHVKEIDAYTFLPSVLDSRRGVCLGVSILYLCIAQRLSLPLEMMTPPGHIYVRYREGECVVNIETTARGIHLDTEEYMSLTHFTIRQRTLKEVVGLTYVNQASVHWQTGRYQQVLEAYGKAAHYMGEDPLLHELMGYALLLNGEEGRGQMHLKCALMTPRRGDAIGEQAILEDYFAGHVDAAGIALLFKTGDDDRTSWLCQKDQLEQLRSRCPYFRAGLSALAATWLHLHRSKEALTLLQAYIALDNGNPEVHYSLALLYAQRHHIAKAWDHLKQSEKIVATYGYRPKILRELRRTLVKHAAE